MLYVLISVNNENLTLELLHKDINIKPYRSYKMSDSDLGSSIWFSNQSISGHNIV